MYSKKIVDQQLTHMLVYLPVSFNMYFYFQKTSKLNNKKNHTLYLHHTYFRMQLRKLSVIIPNFARIIQCAQVTVKPINYVLLN